MRTKIIALMVLAVMLALTFSAPAFAAHTDTDHQGPPEQTGHPFCETGNQYAQEHVRPLAQEQGLGPAHGHTPGYHQGFAVCGPSEG
jgi:Spy/CpxP family protein refolding chaperone